MATSLDTLKRMANKLDASTTILRRKVLQSQRSVAEVLVRKIPDDQHSIEVRVAVLGGVSIIFCKKIFEYILQELCILPERHLFQYDIDRSMRANQPSLGY